MSDLGFSRVARFLDLSFSTAILYWDLTVGSEFCATVVLVILVLESSGASLEL